MNDAISEIGTVIGGHDGGAEGAQEHVDHAHDQRHGDASVMNTSLMAAFTNTEPSKLMLMFMSSGRVAPISAARVARHFRHLDHVGGRLLHDADADGVEPVGAEDAAVFFCAEFHAGDVAKAHGHAIVGLGDRQAAGTPRASGKAGRSAP